MVAIGNSVYMYGGVTEGGKSPELYLLDLSLLRWHLQVEASGTRPSPRSSFGMAAVDDVIVIVGGSADSLGMEPLVFLFDTKATAWLPLSTDSQLPVRFEAASAAQDKTMYLHGGYATVSIAERWIETIHVPGFQGNVRLSELVSFDQTSMKWTTLTPSARSYAASCSVQNTIVVHGGMLNEGMSMQGTCSFKPF
eukprot:541570-Hanusia_phi.AAC.1